MDARLSGDTMLRLSLLEPSELEADQARFYNERTETVQNSYGNRQVKLLYGSQTDYLLT